MHRNGGQTDEWMDGKMAEAVERIKKTEKENNVFSLMRLSFSFHNSTIL